MSKLLEERDNNLLFPGELSVAEVAQRVQAARSNAQELARIVWELWYHDNWRKHPKTYDTWEAFCKDELPVSRRYADELRQSHEVLSSLPIEQRKHLHSTAQISALAEVPAESRPFVLEQARATAPPHPRFQNAKQMSAAHITKTAQALELTEPTAAPHTPPRTGGTPPVREYSASNNAPCLATYVRCEHSLSRFVEVVFRMPGEKRNFSVAVPKEDLSPPIK